MSTHTFNVTGLHCASCSMLIEMTVSDVPGVESVECSHATGATTVTYDPASATPRQIESAIRAAGYDVVASA